MKVEVLALLVLGALFLVVEGWPAQAGGKDP